MTVTSRPSSPPGPRQSTPRPESSQDQHLAPDESNIVQQPIQSLDDRIAELQGESIAEVNRDEIPPLENEDQDMVEPVEPKAQLQNAVEAK